jgi:hypothetical protein
MQFLLFATRCVHFGARQGLPKSDAVISILNIRRCSGANVLRKIQ